MLRFGGKNIVVLLLQFDKRKSCKLDIKYRLDKMEKIALLVTEEQKETIYS